MRRILFLVAVAAFVAVLPAGAWANFAIHGNYTTDTDACAGCHRAHTSYSSVTWTDQLGNDQSALLVGASSEIWEFCYVCHGADAPGADTNVEDGVYEGTLYGETGKTLNGGGFGRPGFEDGTWTSTHMSEGSWGAFGGGITGMDVDSYALGMGPEVRMGCGACHDPHGSPNYRILKSSLTVGDYSVDVGGYGPGGTALDPDPNGFVSSVETGFPQGGFRLHTAYPAYQPNYTRAMYAKGYDQPLMDVTDGAAGLNSSKGMSGWCSGCHTQYSAYNNAVAPSRGATVAASFATTYAAGEWAGAPSNLMLRHRHPMNVELDNYQGPDRDMLLGAIPSLEPTLPVAHAFSERGNPAPQASDWIECLTCHRAHGTRSEMTGFASEAGMESLVDQDGNKTNPYVGNEVSALLRVDNRGVCEGCHNK